MNNTPTPNKPSWKKRLSYTIDQQFSRHPGVLIMWLGLVSIVVMIVIAIALYLTGIAPGDEAPYNFVEALWVGFLATLGDGSIGGRESIWGYRFLMLGVMLFNLFFFSIVIGALTSGMQARLEELRRGRSQIIEQNHTILLGWSEQIFTIISELVRAHASEAHSRIVVLGENNKSEMEDEIRSKVGDTGKVRIICRTGSPLEMTNLDLVSVNTSKNIIILPPDSENPDAYIIKVVLAILNNPDRRQEPYRIVATLRDLKNAEIARVLGKDEVEWIHQGDVISRIIAQTALQPGLSVIYTELFDYSGNEIYLPSAKPLVGKTFGQTLLSSETTTVIGLRQVGQRPLLAPDLDTPIQPGDQLIVIAQDDSIITFQPAAQPLIRTEAIRAYGQYHLQHENTIVIGWNKRGPDILRELDRYAAPESTIMVIANPNLTESDIEQECQNLTNLKVCYLPGDTADRRVLESQDWASYRHMILLAYSEKLSIQQADAITLISLLHVRNLSDTNGFVFSIVTEMLDLRNRKLALADRPDDFIVSDRIISLLMAQVAETRGMCAVYDELFDPEGVEIYIKPADLFVRVGSRVNFYTLVEAARRRQEVAIGYRTLVQTQPAGADYQVILNPPKSELFVLGPKDQVIVLAKS